MKYLSMVFFAFTAMIMLASPGVMAKPNAVTDVNNSCEYDVFTDFEPDCDGCHISTGGLTFWGETYLTEGACGLCTSSCSETTEEQLLKDAKNTTNAYFETLFRKFIMAMKGTGMMDEDGNITNPNIFAAVFPRCPELGPAIASEFSRDTGYLVRRVTTRTRNSRNTPDDWELEQLKKFEDMAANEAPRTQFNITKPDGSILPTKEYEVSEVVKEGIGNDSRFYFRYMRSITMPPKPGDPDVPAEKNPNLPCLMCHGTTTDLGLGVVEAVQEHYPHDMAMGYKKGDIRGAWTIKIPLASRP